MAKSWLEWFASQDGDGWDRREHPGPDIPALVAADFDPVIGTLNWIKFTEVLDAARSQAAGAVLVIDLDDRSSVVEMVAEENGADVLPWLAQAIRQAVRADDLVTHLHGCRFAVLLRGAAQDMAETIAARIMESVEDTMFSTIVGNARLGVVIGGAVFDSNGSREGDIVDTAASNLEVALSADKRVKIQ